MNPQIHSPLIYDKGAKNTQWGKTVSSINGVGKIGQPHEKNETGPLSYTLHNINSKWIKDFNVRPETIKLIEENIGSKLLHMSLGDDFFGFDTKNKGKKSKNRWNYIKLKSICTAKETINKMKRQLTE